MRTPEQINALVEALFPVGCRVRLNAREGAGRFAPKRWHKRKGRVVEHAEAPHDARLITWLGVVWDGRTRRRITRGHHSHFVRVGK